jgi:hypothetical protein
VSNIQPYVVTSVATRRGRQLVRIDAVTAIREAHIEAEAQIMAAQTDAANYIGCRATHNVALLSQMEQQLALAVPQASGRLAAIADLAALTISGIVSDTVCRLGRV